MRFRFDEIDEFFIIYDATRYLTLFGYEKYDAIYNKTKYFLSLKIGITDVFSHYFAKIKISSADSLPIER